MSALNVLVALVAVVTAVVVLLAVWVRTLDHDPERWHVDPSTVEPPSTPNWHLVGPPGSDAPGGSAPVFDADDAAVWAAIDSVIAAEPRTEVVADRRDRGEGLTIVQRSAVFGFPDYVTIDVVPGPSDGTTSYWIFSRARLGQSDLGVNEARIERWSEQVVDRLG